MSKNLRFELNLKIKIISVNISNINNIYFTKITKRDFLYSEINKIENEKKIAAKSGIAIEYLTVSPITRKITAYILTLSMLLKAIKKPIVQK